MSALVWIAVGFCIAIVFDKLLSDRNEAQKYAAILWVLERERKGLEAMELARITGLSALHVYVRLARLEKRGFVRCIEPPNESNALRIFVFTGKRST